MPVFFVSILVSFAIDKSSPSLGTYVNDRIETERHEAPGHIAKAAWVLGLFLSRHICREIQHLTNSFTSDFSSL